MTAEEAIIPRIQVIRGKKIMLDFDIAELYEVPTKRLNEQVKRNLDRFPEDFMFRLTRKEWTSMRSQIATAYKRNTGLLPYAFTEHGVTMLASVLRSEKAIIMSIAVVRAFVSLRKAVIQYADLARQIAGLKDHIGEHDIQLNAIYDTLERLLDEKTEAIAWENRQRIGFKK